MERKKNKQVNTNTKTYYELHTALQAREPVRKLVLHLSHEKWDESTFQKLSQLEHLEIHHRQIKHWPQSLAAHPLLKTLIFKNCKIETKNFPLPPQLKKLRLEHSSITNFQMLPQTLETLEIRGKEMGSALQHLLKKLHPNSRLRQLSVTHAGLKNLPKGILRKLPSLTHLNLSHNNIKNMDEGLEGSRLHLLDLSHNRLIRLPRLSARILLATKNKINSIAPELLQSPDLFELDLSRNPLEELPPLHLPQLSRLDLSYTLLSAWPQGMEQARQLRHLNLSYTRLKKLPRHPPYLPALRSLELNGFSPEAGIGAWPQELQAWQNLRSLQLKRSKLREVPPAFWQLKNLTDCKGPAIFNQALKMLRSFPEKNQTELLQKTWEMLQTENYTKTKLPGQILLALLSSKHLKLRQLAEVQLHTDLIAPEEIFRKKHTKVLLIGRSALPLPLLKKLFERHHISLLRKNETAEADFILLCAKGRPAKISIPENRPLISEKKWLRFLYQRTPLPAEREEKILAMLQSGDANMTQAALRLILLYGSTDQIAKKLQALKNQKEAPYKSLLQNALQWQPQK